jgi:hypothetical protein
MVDTEVSDARKDMDQLGFETKAFEALERDFQEVRTDGAATPPSRIGIWVLSACCS